MATYRMIQDRVKATAGFVPQTCWIADVKAGHGLTAGAASHRIDPDIRAKPCPPEKRSAIEAALRHFKLV
jgi:hypothetical protein